MYKLFILLFNIIISHYILPQDAQQNESFDIIFKL